MTVSQPKQAIILREDLELSTGKAAAQAAHASLKAYEKASREVKEEWKSSGSKKIVLEAGDDVLQQKLELSDRKGVPASEVRDAGFTEVDPGTRTALGIGPGSKSKIDSITGDLSLLD
ncbi:MAG: peptidyl-tRNA hydrolase Pth2 [Candidatus Nanohalobium sp.]